MHRGSVVKRHFDVVHDRSDSIADFSNVLIDVAPVDLEALGDHHRLLSVADDHPGDGGVGVADLTTLQSLRNTLPDHCAGTVFWAVVWKGVGGVHDAPEIQFRNGYRG